MLALNIRLYLHVCVYSTLVLQVFGYHLIVQHPSFDWFPFFISCFLDILGFSVTLPSTSLSLTGVVAKWGYDLSKMVALAAMLGWDATQICARTSKLPTLSQLCGIFHNIDLYPNISKHNIIFYNIQYFHWKLRCFSPPAR